MPSAAYGEGTGRGSSRGRGGGAQGRDRPAPVLAPAPQVEGVIVTSDDRYMVFEALLRIVTQDQVCLPCPWRD